MHAQAKWQKHWRKANPEPGSETAQSFETILHLLPIGIAVAHDLECRSARCNRALADLLGLVRTESEALIPLSELSTLPCRLHVDGRALEEFPLHTACRERNAFAYRNCEIVQNGGRTAHAAIHAQPIVAPDGSTIGSIAVFLNRADWPGKEEEPRDHSETAARLKSFAAGITHSMNNMLVGVIGNASLALDLLEAGHPSRSFLTASLRASNRIAGMVGQIGIYAGHSIRRAESVNVSALIATIRSELLAAIPLNAQFRYWLADVPAIQGDADQLKEALLQVVSNAGDATGAKGGTIHIRTGSLNLSGIEMERMHAAPENPASGKYVYVQVQDGGAGIDPASQPRVFDPFFTTKFFGRGLGLPLVWGIVRCHRGLISVESEPGKGTTVTTYFPVPAAMRIAA